MILDEGRITLLVSRDGATIEFHDYSSGITFAKVEMTPEQFTAALGRQGYVECESMEVFGLENVGKISEHKPLEFEIPEDLVWRRKMTKEARAAELARLADEAADEGWTARHYFSSQNSFFTKDGTQFARTIQERYVSRDELDAALNEDTDENSNGD